MRKPKSKTPVVDPDPTPVPLPVPPAQAQAPDVIKWVIVANDHRQMVATRCDEIVARITSKHVLLSQSQTGPVKVNVAGDPDWIAVDSIADAKAYVEGKLG